MIGTDLDYAQTCKYAVICEGQVSPSEGIIESVNPQNRAHGRFTSAAVGQAWVFVANVKERASLFLQLSHKLSYSYSQPKHKRTNTASQTNLVYTLVRGDHHAPACIHPQQPL